MQGLESAGWASDTVPNYIRVEDAIVGVVDPAGNLENAPTRFVGYLSSCSGALVTVSAIDVDPCTGAETLRRIGSATPKQELRCKWEMRISSITPFTRDYMITTNTPVTTTKNGIKAGQYVAPVTEWIFPEPGVPGHPVQHRLQPRRLLLPGETAQSRLRSAAGAGP